MIKFRCSNCKKKFGVPNDYAGRRIRCNTCDRHTFVPKQSIIDAPAAAASASEPISNPDKADDSQLVLSLSNKDKPPVANTPAQNSPMELQLQSFHNYAPSASETNFSDTADDENSSPKRKQRDLNQAETQDTETDEKGLKLCHPVKIDRIEQVLGISSYISCIGPVIFLFILFSVSYIVSHANSPRVMHSPFAEPDTGPIKDTASLLAAFPAIRYTFYTFAFGISPLAMMISLYLVLRYSYDIPKALYFSIVTLGLIFFTIFKG